MKKRGFTLVEVMLFLAISGALIAIVIVGTQRNIAEKRYNDTVDNLANYLEGLYSSVSYVSHDGGGNSSQAVYGKLVNMDTANNETTFTTYTVLGDADASKISTSTDTLSAILNFNPTIIATIKDEEGQPTGDKQFVHTETYNPSWGGVIMVDPTANDDESGNNDKSQILLLILRHPRTGMTSTYVYYPTSTAEVSTSTTITGENSSLAGDETNRPRNFIKQDANFCVDSDDRWSAGNTRRLIRIHAGANNSSGVEKIANDKKSGFCSD